MEYRNGPACVPNPASDTPTHEVEGVQMVGGCRVRFTPPNCVAVAGFWRRYGGGCFLVCVVLLGSTFARSTLTLQSLTKVFQELLLV